MGMKASEVGAWLRKNTGKRDHHELMPQDYVVLRPGPNFHWLMGMLNDTPAPGGRSSEDSRVNGSSTRPRSSQVVSGSA